MKLYIGHVLAAFCAGAAAIKYDNTAKCCAEDKLNVHLVCHTHDDVGWLKTVDQYYLGSNNSIQHAAVQYILDSVMETLEKDPAKRFTYVEQAFFTRWWNEQSPEKQARVRQLVADEQLVFTNGGWCMHDEAAAHYVGMIDQTTVGHRFISETFGEEALPRVGWQIDPFGHSSTQAALLSGEVGFDALYFGRIDYQDMDVRKANKQLEFLWQASPSLGAPAGVFTGIFPSGNYGPPPGFCFDQFCTDSPINDNPNLFDTNVQAMVDLFVERVMDLKAFYDGNNIMLQMGSDFQYENAREWYKNLDKLIHYVNQDGRLNVFYSSPITYTEARQAEGLAWTTKTDDFFPYADGEHMFWTGYFTSRASLKRLERVTSGYLQTARQLEALSLLSQGSSASSSLSRFEQAQAVAQHHDAVAGTAKQHVAYDYAMRLDMGYTDGEAIVSASLASLLGVPDAKFAHCKNLNESLCAFTQQATAADQAGTFQVLVYNPLAHERSSPVRLPISTPNYAVYHGEDAVASDVLESDPVNDPASSETPAPFTLVFQADGLPPLGVKTYLVKPQSSEEDEEEGHGRSLRHSKRPVRHRHRREDDDLVIANQHLSLTFSSETGRLTAMSRKDAGVSVPVEQDFYYYKGHDGSDLSGQPAGAYIFRPTDDQARLPVSTDAAKLEVVKGKAVTEVRQAWSSWLKQTVRLYDDANYAELEWTVGPIPIEDGVGKEIVSVFGAGLQTNRTLYTDSNGREFLDRHFNYRPTWNLTVHEPVAGNYYPINAAAYIKDDTAQLSIIVDRSQGVGSLNDGEMEVMIQRRLLFDDWRGVGEPLNETSLGITHGNAVRLGDGVIVRGKHLLLLSEPGAAVSEVRSLMDSAFFEALPLFSSDEAVLSSSLPDQLSFAAALPPQIALLTFRKLSENSALVRLAHQYAVGEDATLSQPATVDLSALLTGLDIEAVTELTLTASRPKANLKRLLWTSTDGTVVGEPRSTHDPSPVVVELGPMQIRTFDIAFKYDGPPPPMAAAVTA